MTTFRSQSTTEGAPGYRERSGQPVTVIEEVGADADPDADSEEVAPLYRIRFEDGVETEAFADELDPAPGEVPD
jgi:hypothetical protein